MGGRAGVDGKAEARIDQCYTHREYLLDLISPGFVTAIALFSETKQAALPDTGINGKQLQ
jgi:hypothetical protein